MTPSQKIVIETTKSPVASNWLKRAMLESCQRDVLDAKRDAQLLLEMLELRWNEAIKGQL
jgi:hypothetical protein